MYIGTYVKNDKLEFVSSPAAGPAAADGSVLFFQRRRNHCSTEIPPLRAVHNKYVHFRRRKKNIYIYISIFRLSWLNDYIYYR